MNEKKSRLNFIDVFWSLCIIDIVQIRLFVACDSVYDCCKMVDNIRWNWIIYKNVRSGIHGNVLPFFPINLTATDCYESIFIDMLVFFYRFLSPSLFRLHYRCHLVNPDITVKTVAYLIYDSHCLETCI